MYVLSYFMCHLSFLQLTIHLPTFHPTNKQYTPAFLISKLPTNILFAHCTAVCSNGFDGSTGECIPCRLGSWSAGTYAPKYTPAYYCTVCPTGYTTASVQSTSAAACSRKFSGLLHQLYQFNKSVNGSCYKCTPDG